MCGCRWQWTDRPGVGCRPRTERALRDDQPEPYPISPELGQLLVLSRVRRGRVVLVGRDLLIGHGRRGPDYIRALLRELLDDGHLYLGDERVEWGQRPVLITPWGEQLHAKLQELCR